MEDMPQTPLSTRSLKPENLKSPVTPSPLLRRRRVMFEQNSPAKEVIYEIESSSKGSKERELSTDASSAESLPLDVSRYDNVSPQSKGLFGMGEKIGIIKDRPHVSPDFFTGASAYFLIETISRKHRHRR